MTFEFELTGITPLLMHADDVEAADELEAWRKDQANKNKSKPGDDRSPPWSWTMYLHTDGEHVSMPQELIAAALMKAAANFSKKGQKTFKADTMSAVAILDEHCELHTPRGRVSVATINKLSSLDFSEQAKKVQELGFRLFVKRAKVGQSKHVRVRARFDHWVVRGTIDVDTDEIAAPIFERIFEYAGNKCGLGDWRPSAPKSPGPFGRFKVKLKAA